MIFITLTEIRTTNFECVSFKTICLTLRQRFLKIHSSDLFGILWVYFCIDYLWSYTDIYFITSGEKNYWILRECRKTKKATILSKQKTKSLCTIIASLFMFIKFLRLFVSDYYKGLYLCRTKKKNTKICFLTTSTIFILLTNFSYETRKIIFFDKTRKRKPNSGIISSKYCISLILKKCLCSRISICVM